MARRLTGGITLRKRKRRGAYYRILSSARLRRARKGLAKRLTAKLQTVRLLAQCAQPQGKSSSAVAQAKQY
jgi:hypothetical protein